MKSCDVSPVTSNPFETATTPTLPTGGVAGPVAEPVSSSVPYAPANPETMTVLLTKRLIGEKPNVESVSAAPDAPVESGNLTAPETWATGSVKSNTVGPLTTTS